VGLVVTRASKQKVVIKPGERRRLDEHLGTMRGVPVTRREATRCSRLVACSTCCAARHFHEDATSVLAKFEQTMNASERKEHGALGQHFAYVPDGGTKAYEGKEDLIDALQIRGSCRARSSGSRTRTRVVVRAVAISRRS